jgi:hypothetical protein
MSYAITSTWWHPVLHPIVGIVALAAGTCLAAKLHGLSQVCEQVGATSRQWRAGCRRPPGTPFADIS